MSNILLITKGNSDGSIVKGDRVFFDEQGDLNLLTGIRGWIFKDRLNQNVLDFEYIEEK
jgi:hypothetical protein